VSDGDKPYFPPPTRGRAPYRGAERVTPATPPTPRQVEATRAEPPPASTDLQQKVAKAPFVPGLTVEERLARDHALGNARANEWAARAGISIAIRIFAVVFVLALVPVLAWLPRPLATLIVVIVTIVGGIATLVWRVRRFFRRIREKEGNW
jgi:hypothetical protein